MFSDIFVLRSAESGQMEYGVYDKYLMIKNVSLLIRDAIAAGLRVLSAHLAAQGQATRRWSRRCELQPAALSPLEPPGRRA